MGRIADLAGRLPNEVKRAVGDVTWDDIRDVRTLVDHIYHRIDYDALWKTLEEDVPVLLERLHEWTRAQKIRFIQVAPAFVSPVNMFAAS